MSRGGRGRGEYTLEHNPGYDFYRFVKHCEAFEPNEANLKALPFAGHLIPSLALLGACCAIEAYINLVGQVTDPDWDSSKNKKREPFKERITRLYEGLEMTPQFGNGIEQRVIFMFEMRNELVHPKYRNEERKADDHLPTVFDEIEEKYPPKTSRKIADEFIDKILKESGCHDMKRHWCSRGYCLESPRKST